MAFPVDDKFIRDAEEKLGIRLPNSYKGWVRLDNGGQIGAMDETWQLFPAFDRSDRRRTIKTSGPIVRETQAAKK